MTTCNIYKWSWIQRLQFVIHIVEYMLVQNTFNKLIHKWVSTPPDRTQVNSALCHVDVLANMCCDNDFDFIIYEQVPAHISFGFPSFGLLLFSFLISYNHLFSTQKMVLYHIIIIYTQFNFSFYNMSINRVDGFVRNSVYT